MMLSQLTSRGNGSTATVTVLLWSPLDYSVTLTLCPHWSTTTTLSLVSSSFCLQILSLLLLWVPIQDLVATNSRRYKFCKYNVLFLANGTKFLRAVFLLTPPKQNTLLRCCIIPLSCWQALENPYLAPSLKTLPGGQ